MRKLGATFWSPMLIIYIQRAPGCVSELGLLEALGNYTPAIASGLLSCGRSLIPVFKLE